MEGTCLCKEAGSRRISVVSMNVCDHGPQVRLGAMLRANPSLFMSHQLGQRAVSAFLRFARPALGHRPSEGRAMFAEVTYSDGDTPPNLACCHAQYPKTAVAV